MKRLILFFLLIPCLAFSQDKMLGRSSQHRFKPLSAIADTVSASKKIGLSYIINGTNQLFVSNGTDLLAVSGITGGVSAWVQSGIDIYNGNSGNVGIGTSSPSSTLEILGSETNGYLIVGDNTGNIGTNPVITMDRTTDAAEETGHGIEDRSYVYKNGSYAAFDSRILVPADAVGEYTGKHYIGFQAAHDFYATDNELGDGDSYSEGIVGFASIIGGGPGTVIDKAKHILIDDISFDATCTLNNQYGIFVKDGGLSSATNNWLIYNDDYSASIYNRGPLLIGTNLNPQAVSAVFASTGNNTVDIVCDRDDNGETEDAAIRFFEDGGATVGTQKGIIKYDRSDAAFEIGYGATREINIQEGKVGIGTSSPSEILHIDDAGGTDGTGRWFANASATTTDATLTAIYTLGTTTDHDYLIEVSYVASETDGSNEYYAKLFFAVSNVAGIVTEDDETDIYEQDNSAAAAADASGAVSGTDYLVQVTGVDAETWNWEVSINVVEVVH